MRALTYHGSNDVRVETVPAPILKYKEDVILRVTATAICGSDLHLYRGKIPEMRDGDILGHEFMDVVEDVGSRTMMTRPISSPTEWHWKRQSKAMKSSIKKKKPAARWC